MRQKSDYPPQKSARRLEKQVSFFWQEDRVAPSTKLPDAVPSTPEPLVTLSPRTARRALLLASAAGLLVGTVQSSAGPLPTPAVAVAPAQAAITGFATPIVVATQGQALSFVNGDVTGHTLTSKETKAVRIKYGRKYYTIRKPLFDSDSVNAGSVGDVKGVSSLKPGTYHFYCSLHTSMTGTLQVQAAG